MSRQAILDTDRRFILLHTEGALRWHVGSPAIMGAQLDHLAELTGRPHVELGIIPWDRPLTMHARYAFHLYDTRTVIVGTESGPRSSPTRSRSAPMTTGSRSWSTPRCSATRPGQCSPGSPTSTARSGNPLAARAARSGAADRGRRGLAKGLLTQLGEAVSTTVTPRSAATPGSHRGRPGRRGPPVIPLPTPRRRFVPTAPA